MSNSVERRFVWAVAVIGLLAAATNAAASPLYRARAVRAAHHRRQRSARAGAGALAEWADGSRQRGIRGRGAVTASGSTQESSLTRAPDDLPRRCSETSWREVARTRRNRRADPVGIRSSRAPTTAAAVREILTLRDARAPRHSAAAPMPERPRRLPLWLRGVAADSCALPP